MSVLLDSNIFIAYYNKRDENHKNAVEIIRQMEGGSLGTPYITDYVFDEVVTYLQKKVSEKDAVVVGEQCLKYFQFIFTTPEIFSESWKLFKKYQISFTDCTLLVTKNMWKIEDILTFDKRLNELAK